MTIRPSSETNDALAQLDAAVSLENPAVSLEDSDVRKERMPLVWIPATICLGLLIATVYLGARILTAHSHAAAPVQASTVPQSVPIKAAAQVAPAAQIAPAPAASAETVQAPAPPPEAPKLLADEQLPIITPQPGERYIQVSALNQEAAERYIRQLRQAKLEPHAAPGPRPELLRVLIGPFAEQDALTRAKNDLAQAGITNFVRKY